MKTLTLGCSPDCKVGCCRFVADDVGAEGQMSVQSIRSTRSSLEVCSLGKAGLCEADPIVDLELIVCEMISRCNYLKVYAVSHLI